MLVLSRKQGQQIQISDDVTITITQIKGNQVRLGIEAPRDVAIRRGELKAGSKIKPHRLGSGMIVDIDPSMLLSCESTPIK